MVKGLAYHYCDERAFNGIVSRKCLWASESNSMNDLQEVRWTRTLLDEILPRIKDLPDFLVVNTKMFLDKGPEVYLTCFSTEVDLLSQWVRYASDGTGFAIGFDERLIAERRIPPDPMYHRDREVCDGVFEVFYERERQEWVLMSLIENALPACRSGDDVARDKAMAHLWGGIGVYRPFFKHPGFREEREIRYIRHHRPVCDVMNVPDAFTRSLKTRKRSDEMIRYFEKSFQPEAIKEVWIGPTSERRPQEIRQFLADCGVTAVDVRKSDIPYRRMPKASC